MPVLPVLRFVSPALAPVSVTSCSLTRFLSVPATLHLWLFGAGVVRELAVVLEYLILRKAYTL